MKQIISLYVIIFIAIASSPAIAAVKVFECEDEAGNRAYYNACPPGSYVVKEKMLAIGSSGRDGEEESTTNISATIYTTPDCETCDEVKEFLQNRNISITEKSVDKDILIQQELTELSGALKVPTAIIGKNNVIGYNRAELKAALKAAGYKEKLKEEKEIATE